MDKPKKYVKINGVMKLNPEYKRWKEAQNAHASPSVPAAPATTVFNSAEALPIVSTMEDHFAMNEDMGQAIPLAESTNATIEMLQEEEIAAEAGLSSDTMMDELGNLLAKYEIPIGLINKLMALSEYQSLEFIIDDSGSMQMATDSKGPDGTQMTRWAEAQQRLKEMIEIIAYVPFEQIGIEFLNRKDRISLRREGRSPHDFKRAADRAVDAVFSRSPRGTTPALEKLKESFLRGQGASIVRYFFGDGKPDGGRHAMKEIVQLLKNRLDPEQNPVTFISCTNDDEAVEWMKDAEEVVPYCSESDDFNDEAREIYKDQGAALPFSKGFHLICQLVAVMNPDDLDAMDESIPFTKYTLDNLLGFVSSEPSYRHYFDKFIEAQQKRPVGESELDRIRTSARWNYQDFRAADGAATGIRQVREMKERMKRARTLH